MAVQRAPNLGVFVRQIGGPGPIDLSASDAVLGAEK